MKQNFEKTLLLMVIAILLGCTSTKIYQPKRLDITGDFVHKTTKIAFPENFDQFERASITCFNKDSSDIGISYRSGNPEQYTISTIYIYPAPSADEFRLRMEYYKCLDAIELVANRQPDIKPNPIKISKDGFSVLGISAMITGNNPNTGIVLFECGKYFIKYRISSNNMNLNDFNNISTKLLISALNS